MRPPTSETGSENHELVNNALRMDYQPSTTITLCFLFINRNGFFLYSVGHAVPVTWPQPLTEGNWAQRLQSLVIKGFTTDELKSWDSKYGTAS